MTTTNIFTGTTAISTAVTTPPIDGAGVTTGELITYLSLNGNANSYALTASSTDLNALTNDMSVVMRVNATSWTPAGTQSLVSLGTSATTGWSIQVLTSGKLRFTWITNLATPTMVNADSTVATGNTNATAYWIKVDTVYNGGSGRTVLFYTAPDLDTEPTVWTQLGTTVTSTAGNLTASSLPLVIGNLYAGASNGFIGNFYRCIVRSNLTSTTRFDADFTTQKALATSFNERTNKAVAINSPAALVSGDAGWRMAVQLLIASGGARVGKSKVGTARVSGYAWLDITGDVAGIDTVRGASPAGAGYPRANVGTCNLTINNVAGKYSSWNTTGTIVTGTINTAIANREYSSNTIMRVAFFKNGATSTVSGPAANGLWTITRSNWQPKFTGFVESWNELDQGGISTNVIQATAVETLSRLASLVYPTAAVVVPDTTPPTVNVPTVAWNSTGVQVTWTAVTDAVGVTSMKLQANYAGAGYADTGYTQANGNAGTTLVTTPGANRGQTVTFRMVASDAAGNTATSGDSASVQTKPQGTFQILASNGSDSKSDGTGSWSHGAAWEGGWTGQDLVKAGNVSGGLYGVETGAWFYSTQFADTCKGFAPDSATIYMIRSGSSGVSGVVTYQGISDTQEPAGTTQVTYVGSSQTTASSLTGTNGTVTESLPAGMLTNMGNGTLKGFGIFLGAGTTKVLQGVAENGFSGWVSMVFS